MCLLFGNYCDPFCWGDNPFAEHGVSAYLEKKKHSQKVAKKKLRKASRQKKQSCQLMRSVSQDRASIGSQPEDASSVNLSHGEADAAPPRVAQQPASKVVASADEGIFADALSHSTANTANGDQAQGHNSVASAVAPSSVAEPQAAAAAAALPAFRLPAAVADEPAGLPQLQLARTSAHLAAVLVPVNPLSLAGRLPDVRVEAAHVAPEGPSAIREPAVAAAMLPEAAVPMLAQVPQLQRPASTAQPDALLAPAVFPRPAGSLPSELQAKDAHTTPNTCSAVREAEAAAPAAATDALTLPETVPQLKWPVLSAHPAAVLAPAAFPGSASRLPPKLLAEDRLTTLETSSSGAPSSSNSQQLSPAAVAEADRVCSPKQHHWPAQADQAGHDDRIVLSHDASQQAPAMADRLQVQVLISSTLFVYVVIVFFAIVHDATHHV